MGAGAREGHSLAELVDVLEIAAVGTAESALVNDGTCVPPTMHMISDLPSSPYIGYVMSRPFFRGADAAAAVAAMGGLPAAVRARRLVLTWEHADLSAALQAPGAPFPTAVVVVDAGRDGHEVRRHPFEIEVGPPAPSGQPTVAPVWSAPWREVDGDIPRPVAELLTTWRAGGDPRELRWIAARMECDGYTVHWMTKKRANSARATSAGS